MADAELIADVVRYAVEDGDVLFVNAETIDIEALISYPFFRNTTKKFAIVPVMVPPGRSVADCMAVANKETQNGTKTKARPGTQRPARGQQTGVGRT